MNLSLPLGLIIGVAVNNSALGVGVVVLGKDVAVGIAGLCVMVAVDSVVFVVPMYVGVGKRPQEETNNMLRTHMKMGKAVSLYCKEPNVRRVGRKESALFMTPVELG